MTFNLLKKRAQNLWKKFLKLMDSHPLATFFGFLGLLFVLVVVGSILRKPAPVAPTVVVSPKLVEPFALNSSPKQGFTAKIQKSGDISIYAQTPGIVQRVNLSEGKHVVRGQTLVSLSSNYQGGNAASLAREIAQKNNDAAVANFDLQEDVINRQRDIANKTDTLATDMRSITRASIGDTQSLIDLDQDIVNNLSNQITTLQNSNPSDPTLLGLKQQKAGAQAALIQLQSGLRVSQYQSNDATVSAQLADQARDMTLRQLDLQERGLTLAKDMADLNLKLAKVSEGMMFPAAPCAGVVQRVYVSVGQNVNPGTLIATIKADQGQNAAVVLVPREIAAQVSKTQESTFLIGGQTISLVPRFVSTEATDGSLYSVLYDIPAIYAPKLTNQGFIAVQIPIGSSKLITDDIYIPLDSVYQTQEKSYVYVIEAQKAKVREVQLAEVSGNFVKVTGGISNSDVVIVSRNVQEGDLIRTE